MMRKNLRSAVLSLTIALPLALGLTYTTTAKDFLYNFNTPGILVESSPSSPYYFLDSGAYFYMLGGVGMTQQGPLAMGDPWQILYCLGAPNNPIDTAQGQYPQNLFRLVTKWKWTGTVTNEVHFKITGFNQTDTSNRDGYSGILLFCRYVDSSHLYYGGIRQDGTAVIKKKYGSVAEGYTTMGEWPLFTNGRPYNRNTNPNLLPMNVWMGLKMAVTDVPGGVQIRLWLNVSNDGKSWTEIGYGSDVNGKYAGTPVLTQAASAGLRTDYMDVVFENHHVTP